MAAWVPTGGYVEVVLADDGQLLMDGSGDVLEKEGGRMRGMGSVTTWLCFLS